jgi:hypothetical protein
MNGQSREAFLHVWNGIFDAVHAITGKQLTFKIFSKLSPLLCVIGDQESAQALGFADMVIARRLNVGALPSMVDPDSILKHLWKTCLVHFERCIYFFCH